MLISVARRSILTIFIFLSFTFADTVLASSPSSTTRIFWVDSYNSDYEWSAGVGRGIHSILAKKDVHLGIFHMDTKSCKNEECFIKTAEKAKQAIEEFQPDVLIASDDNAQKYLVVPYYKTSSLPVVFCGINWDASSYGYPTDNITGMVEVDLVEETKQMQKYAKGNRIGYISGKTKTDEKVASWLNKHYFNMELVSYHVSDFAEFKIRFLQLQEETDMIIIRNYAAIQNWEPLAVKNFLINNLKVPTASSNPFMSPYVVFNFGKVPEEQGRYAAETALKIAHGVAPSSFPITRNQEAQLTVNLAMADAAGIIIPVSMLKVAKVIGQEDLKQQRESQTIKSFDFTGKRVLWVDSYHNNYEWSSGIEHGIREVFFGKEIELKIVRMDSKRKNSEPQIKAAALRAKIEIEKFNPDIIIASDDNAQKHLISPFFKNSKYPVVFCGVNWDATMYGYPTGNITGMIEVELIEELIHLLKENDNSQRVGYLSSGITTEHKIINIINDKFFNGQLKSYVAKNQKELEEKFIQAQSEVDILIFSNYTGIENWDAKATTRLVKEHTKIPTGSHQPFMANWVVCTLAKSSGEQGRFAATTSLKILSGTPISEIPITTNTKNSLTINIELAQKTGIVFPVSVLKQAELLLPSKVE